jgi:hypothetical protein
MGMTNAAAAKPRPAALLVGQTVSVYGRTLTVTQADTEYMFGSRPQWGARASDGERTYIRTVYHCHNGWRARWSRAGAR